MEKPFPRVFEYVEELGQTITFNGPKDTPQCCRGFRWALWEVEDGHPLWRERPAPEPPGEVGPFKKGDRVVVARHCQLWREQEKILHPIGSIRTVSTCVHQPGNAHFATGCEWTIGLEGFHDGQHWFYASAFDLAPATPSAEEGERARITATLERYKAIPEGVTPGGHPIEQVVATCVSTLQAKLSAANARAERAEERLRHINEALDATNIPDLDGVRVRGAANRIDLMAEQMRRLREANEKLRALAVVVEQYESWWIVRDRFDQKVLNKDGEWTVACTNDTWFFRRDHAEAARTKALAALSSTGDGEGTRDNLQATVQSFGDELNTLRLWLQRQGGHLEWEARIAKLLGYPPFVMHEQADLKPQVPHGHV